MKITVNKELENNNYKVTLSVSELEKGNYMEAIRDYGEDAINLGGEIKEGETVLATISNNNVKITDISKHSIEQDFYTQQYSANTQKIAEAWSTFAVDTIKKYVSEMSAKVDDFSETEVFDV